MLYVFYVYCCFSSANHYNVYLSTESSSSKAYCDKSNMLGKYYSNLIPGHPDN